VKFNAKPYGKNPASNRGRVATIMGLDFGYFFVRIEQYFAFLIAAGRWV
jgi:hypothetical protein